MTWLVLVSYFKHGDAWSRNFSWMIPFSNLTPKGRKKQLFAFAGCGNRTRPGFDSGPPAQPHHLQLPLSFLQTLNWKQDVAFKGSKQQCWIWEFTPTLNYCWLPTQSLTKLSLEPPFPDDHWNLRLHFKFGRPVKDFGTDISYFSF